MAGLVRDEAVSGYLSAYADPFGVVNPPGLPTFPSQPSRKIALRIKGTLTVGTGGWGFAALQPNPASDATSLLYSGSTYAGTSIATSGTGVNAANFTNAPVVTASYTSSAYQQRMVMCALRVRYTGSENSRGGVIYPANLPDHKTLDGITATALTSNAPCADSYPVTRQWVTVRSHPVTPAETDYQSNIGFAGVPIIGFLISSTAGLTFEFDGVAMFEIIGGVGSDCTMTKASVHGPGILSQLTNNPIVHNAAQNAARWTLGRLANSVFSTVTNAWTGPRLGDASMRAIGRGAMQAIEII
jgi:hypothetical protein